MSEAVSGRLEEMGLVEVEPGIVEDTHENRRRLQLNDEEIWDWERVRDENDELTGLIRLISPEERIARRLSIADRRRPILTHPDNPWSDYVHPDEYPLDVEMPWWVDMRLRHWREQAAAGVPEQERRRFPTRCSQLRTDNTRCWNWVGNPDKVSVCKAHTHQTREALTRTPVYARERVLELSITAVDTLGYLMEHAAGEAVRLKASTEVLDRVGIRSGVEVDVTARLESNPGDQLQERLATLAKRHAAEVTEEPDTPLALPTADIVEGEIVEP